MLLIKKPQLFKIFKTIEYRLLLWTVSEINYALESPTDAGSSKVCNKSLKSGKDF